VNPTRSWKVEYENEISRAIGARSDGNEGMARVCARRAAGIIIGEYLSRRGHKNLKASVYSRLLLFNSLPYMDEAVKEIAGHFLLKVNHDRTLPVDVDLISEAERLAKILLLESSN
jgi:hypothetical protein